MSRSLLYSTLSLRPSFISSVELAHRDTAELEVVPEPGPGPADEDSDTDSDTEYSDDSSEYSSTDSEDDENSENYQACREVFEYIDVDKSELIELDEILDSWQQLAQVRYENCTVNEGIGMRGQKRKMLIVFGRASL